MKVTLIHNPDAGAGDDATLGQLLRDISNAGFAATYQSAKTPDWHTALDAPADLIAVAGGDGIVGRVAKRCIGRGIPIAVLPLGTANNIARTLRLTDVPLNRLIAQWREAPRTKVDMACATGPWGALRFIEGLGVGLFTDVMTRLDARQNLDLAHLSNADEKIASVQDVLRKRLSHFPSFKMKVFMDGRDLSGDFILLEALNIQSVGPNLRLAPQADPADGLLDLAVFYDGQQEVLIRQLVDPARVDAPPKPPWFIHRGKRLEITLQGLPLHIDDEAWPAENSQSLSSTIEVTATINGDSLQFLAWAG